MTRVREGAWCRVRPGAGDEHFDGGRRGGQHGSSNLAESPWRWWGYRVRLRRMRTSNGGISISSRSRAAHPARAAAAGGGSGSRCGGAA